MAGKLYGIGVGPGDPGLLTIKAKDLIERATVIAYPVSKRGESSTALEIVKGVIDISEKCSMELLFSMNPDDNVRKMCQVEAVKELAKALDKGSDVVMLTLGDVSVYSTYMYVDNEIKELGYETEVIPGIPSFCSGAAKARIPLMIGDESLVVVPMAKRNTKMLESALLNFDNIVVMKTWDSMNILVETMKKSGLSKDNATVISNIGMEGEYIGPIDLEQKYGYFTTVIIKKNKGEKK